MRIYACVWGSFLVLCIRKAKNRLTSFLAYELALSGRLLNTTLC